MDYVTVKMYADTRRLLRLIAAQTDEQMVQVMQRLCEGEWGRVQRGFPTTAPEDAAVGHEIADAARKRDEKRKR